MLHQSNRMLRGLFYQGMSSRGRVTVLMHQQRATISFQHSMQSCQIPHFHVTDTVNPACPGKTLVMTFSKCNNSDSVEHIKNMIPEEIACDVKTLIAESVEDGSFSADANEKYVLRVPKMSDCCYKHLVLVGVGSEPDNKKYKDVGKHLISIAKDLKAPDIDILLHSEAVIPSVLLGVEDASYDDKRYKGTCSDSFTSTSPFPSSDGKNTLLESVSFTNIPSGHLASLNDLVNIKHKISVGVHITKDLVGEFINFNVEEVEVLYNDQT